jgi:hypothetical protein
MNFTYVIILPNKTEFGSKDANGSWTGMVGQISRGEIDIGKGSFINDVMVLERDEVDAFVKKILSNNNNTIIIGPVS